MSRPSVHPLTCRLLAPLLLVLTLFAGAAHAHAVLQSTTPADGSLLQTAPGTAALVFNEPVRPLAIRLIAPDGSETDLTDQVAAAAALQIPLPELERGTHVLSWRVASDDGHPVAGSLIFSLAEVTGAAITAETRDPALSMVIWAARFLMAAGLVLGVGGALYGAISPLPPAARRPVAGAVLLGLVAAPAYLGLHGLDALGLGFAALADAAPWRAAAGTAFGPSTGLAMLAALTALAALRWPLLGWVALAALAAAYATSGHAGAAEPRWLTRPMVFLHLAALCFWIGALLPLALSLTPSRQGIAPPALRRYSAVLPVAVILLLGSGLALAIVQLGPDPAAWWSPYGAILAAKLALLAALFMLAAFNRWRLTGPALGGAPHALARLRRMIAAELVLALLILALAAGWRFTPPPRALAQITAQPAPAAYGHLHSTEVMANLIITPGKAGPALIEIELTDSTFAPLGAMAVTLGLSLPDRGIEQLTREARLADGHENLWIIPDLVLPLAGIWTLDLEVRQSRFSLLRLAGEIEIK
ncbi:copper resistance protein CopC [Szabonella alba]|uniref:Copper resistance protein CopC/CopD n=1 Tax=Szabonella alba TaxID=2804194 RepID=A0A8K0V745_9RHOB|nr:copper resistance protein CopC [Szabonella alba]MBL4916376.1 copper resistance protein CopC/CopD [Szabonella alba]